MHKLATEFEGLGRLYRSLRTGQLVIYEPYILGEKLCKGLAQVCRGLDKSAPTGKQDQNIIRKLRLLRTLVQKSVKA